MNSRRRSSHNRRSSRNFFSRSTITENPDNCAICHETLTRQTNNPLVKLTPCSHKLHKSCLIPWIAQSRDTCPICREVVASYVELDENGADTSNVTTVHRVIHNYPSSNSFVFLAVTEEVSISYIFMADAFLLRTGEAAVDLLRIDRHPARVQFTIGPNKMVPLYQLLIVQAKYYVLKVGDSYFSLEAILSNIARRMSIRGPQAVVDATSNAGSGGGGGNSGSVPNIVLSTGGAEGPAIIFETSLLGNVASNQSGQSGQRGGSPSSGSTGGAAL